MNNRKDIVISVLLVIVASMYPFCYRVADNYRTITFQSWMSLIVQTLFPIIITFFSVLLINEQKKCLFVRLIMTVISILVGCCLFFGSYTMAIFPIQNVFASAVLLFDTVLNYMSSKIEKRQY